MRKGNYEGNKKEMQVKKTIYSSKGIDKNQVLVYNSIENEEKK